MADIFRKPLVFAAQRKPVVSVGQVPNLLLSTFAIVTATAPFRPAAALSPIERREMPRAEVFPNLPLSTLDFQKIASGIPESLPPLRPRRLLSETSAGMPLTLRTFVAQRPFTPILTFEPKARRTPVDTSASSPFALLRTVVQAPFAAPLHTPPARKQFFQNTSAASPQVLLTTVVQRPFAAPPFFGPVIKRFYGDTSLRNLQTGTLAPPFVPPKLVPVHIEPQRRQNRPAVQQDNFLPLRTTIVLRPFAQLEWPAPVDHRLHFESAPEILLAPFFRGGSQPITLPTDIQELAHKLTAVDTTFTLDFISRLDAGEAISSVVTTISVFSGTDANPNGLKAATPSISRTRVRQLTTGGNPGVLYALTASVRTSTGRTLTMLGIFAVLDPDEVPA